LENKADLIIYHQKGCKPCKTAVPTAIEYAKKIGLTYRVVDVHSIDPEDQRLSLGVKWTPTYILNGKEAQLEELAELAKDGAPP
jgi:hypothetical protein